jgi:hypothetical protein
LLAACLGLLASARAHAFVQSKTDMGKGFFWKESCVPVTIYLNRFPAVSGMTAEQVVKSVAAAAHAWSSDAVTCSSGGAVTSPYLEIVPSLADPAAVPPAVTNPDVAGSWDARNSIIFRTESWSRSGKSSPGSDYAFEALAVTTVTARSDGHIVDVDMEVNGVSKSWMNLDPGITVPFDHGDTQQIYDLQNALTHEFGHFIGLDHTCFTPSLDNPSVGTDGRLRPQDDQGKPIPDCVTAPAGVAATVMFNVTSPGEVSKRDLAPDDVRAVCTIYAPSQPHEECALDSASPGCVVAPARAPRRGARGWALAAPAGALGAALALAARRRRARGLSDRDRARS